MKSKHAYTMVEAKGGEPVALALLLEEWLEYGSPPQFVHPHHDEVWCSPGMGYGRVAPHKVSL
jgi:hypothetical protein